MTNVFNSLNDDEKRAVTFEANRRVRQMPEYDHAQQTDNYLEVRALLGRTMDEIAADREAVGRACDEYRKLQRLQETIRSDVPGHEGTVAPPPTTKQI